MNRVRYIVRVHSEETIRIVECGNTLNCARKRCKIINTKAYATDPFFVKTTIYDRSVSRDIFRYDAYTEAFIKVERK